MSNGRNLCESSGGGRNVGLTRHRSTGRTSPGFPRILPTRISPTGGIVQVMNCLNTQRSLSHCGAFSPEEASRMAGGSRSTTCPGTVPSSCFPERSANAA